MKQSMHIGIEYQDDRGKALIDTGERGSRPEHLVTCLSLMDHGRVYHFSIALELVILHISY